MGFKNYLLAVFHFVCAVQFYYALYYEVVHVLPEELKIRSYSLGGKLVYLTFYDGIFHAAFHTIAFINDVIGTNETAPANPPLIRRVRDFIFSSFCIPLGAKVATMFWSLYMVDRELVFPTVMDSFYPWWLNHILHTNVFVLIVVEMFLSHHQYPSNRLHGLAGLGAFIGYYFAILLSVKYFADAWVYPIFDVLDFHQRFGLFTISGLSLVGFYFLGEKVNDLIWKQNRNALKEKQK